MPRNNPIPPAVAEDFYLAPIAQVWRALLGQGWQDDALARLTHIELEERNGATRVRLIQTGFQSTKERDTHASRWQRRLSQLGKYFRQP